MVLLTLAPVSVSSTALFANQWPDILLIDNDDHFFRTVLCYTEAYDWVKPRRTLPLLAFGFSQGGLSVGLQPALGKFACNGLGTSGCDGGLILKTVSP